VPDAEGVLRFAGGVGTGFTDAALRRLQQRLEPLRRRTAPAPDVPREHARRAVWVEPQLVGEVAYRSFTPDGRIRHGSWRGLRPDKAPADVRRADRPAIAGPAPTVTSTPASTPAPAQASAPASVAEAMQTPDGAWRVEVVRRNRSQWYRITHGDNTFDWLTIDAVRRILHDAGIDLADLTEAQPAA
jgi:bifunctional non-homologous end joining protein LigD